MSELTAIVTPGYSFAAGELVTLDKLNLLGQPVVNLSGTINASTIADGSISTVKLADGILSADAAGRAKMADGYITLAKVGAGIFTADAAGRGKFADGFVNTAKLADGAVTAAKLASGTITATQLADGSVTAAKLASGLIGVTMMGNYDLLGASGIVANAAHGVSGTILAARWVLRCVTNDQGYAVGDEIDLWAVDNGGTGLLFSGGVNSSNVFLVQSGNAMSILSRVGGAVGTGQTALMSRWKARCYIAYLGS